MGAISRRHSGQHSSGTWNWEAFVPALGYVGVGRCLLSHYLTGAVEPGNALEHRPGQAFEVGETEEEVDYILNGRFMSRAFMKLEFYGGAWTA